MNKFKHIEDIQRRIFAAMLSNLDDSVGGIMKKLAKENLEKDTLVFFLSDNGGPTRELTSSNLPLRGEKGQMYEGGIRVPFLFQWPGKVPAGKTYDRPVLSTDIFATIHAAAGAPKPQGKYIESYDLLPYLTGEYKEDPHEWLYWRQSRKAAFRVGDMKIVRQTPKSGNSTTWPRILPKQRTWSKRNPRNSSCLSKVGKKSTTTWSNPSSNDP